jgi:outer membrane protein
MKNSSTILSLLSLTGVAILFWLFFSNSPKLTSGSQSVSTGPLSGALKLGYVNVDSFNAHYEFVKTKNAEFQKRQTQMEAELQRSASQFENAYREFQRKVQSGAFTQTEGETEQRRLGQLQLREQALNDQLLKEKENFNNLLQKQLDEFLARYSKENNFDFVLSYSNSLPLILYANKSFDVTQDVIEGMNKQSFPTEDSSKRK